MKTKTRLWTTLEALTTPAAVLAEWQAALGPEFVAARVYLRPTQDQARTYPCINLPQCDCRHEIVATANDGKFRAVCRCELDNCPPLLLNPCDILIHELDIQMFCRAIRCSFKFDDPPDERATPYGASYVWPVGIYGNLRSSVYLLIRPSEQEFLKEIEGLITGQADPFILLAPTRQHLTPHVQAVLQRHKAAFIPLSGTLALDAPDRFKVISSIQPILDRFAQGLAEGTGLVKTVEKFGRDIEAVAKGNYELRKENEELRQLHAEGFLQFANNVDAKDFTAFITILAKGNRKAAADELKIPYRSFYDSVDKWRGMGSEYKRMFRIVECRKKIGRKIMVRMPDSILGLAKKNKPENPETISAVNQANRDRKAESKDHSELLREILAALSEQNPQNWQSVQKELIEIIKEEIPQ